MCSKKEVRVLSYAGGQLVLALALGLNLPNNAFVEQFRQEQESDTLINKTKSS